MSLVNAFETHVLTYLFTTGSVTRPTAWYIGLFTDNPDEAGAGTEISGNGYARKAVTFTVSGNNASNSSAIDFDAATGSWGTITHAAIFDAASSGNMIAYGSLTTSKAVTTGDILRLASGEFDVNLD
jgi:hypothetical protein